MHDVNSISLLLWGFSFFHFVERVDSFFEGYYFRFPRGVFFHFVCGVLWLCYGYVMRTPCGCAMATPRACYDSAMRTPRACCGYVMATPRACETPSLRDTILDSQGGSFSFFYLTPPISKGIFFTFLLDASHKQGDLFNFFGFLL